MPARTSHHASPPRSSGSPRSSWRSPSPRRPSPASRPPGQSANFPYHVPRRRALRERSRFENTSINARDTVFDPARDGSFRILSRGSAVSRAVDQETGAVYPHARRLSFITTFAADGSVRVDATGTDIIAWYFPGDDSELGPGMWDINGHVTEWYAPDGSFIKATFSGHATDICAALEG